MWKKYSTHGVSVCEYISWIRSMKTRNRHDRTHKKNLVKRERERASERQCVTKPRWFTFIRVNAFKQRTRVVVQREKRTQWIGFTQSKVSFTQSATSNFIRIADKGAKETSNECDRTELNNVHSMRAFYAVIQPASNTIKFENIKKNKSNSHRSNSNSIDGTQIKKGII